MSSIARFAIRRFATRRFYTTAAAAPGHNLPICNLPICRACQKPICPACQTKRPGALVFLGKWFNPIHHPDNCVYLATYLFTGVILGKAIMIDRERGWPGHKKLFKDLLEKLSKMA